MSYKTLLVCLNNEAEARRLLPVACLLARQFDAHLTGLFSIQNMEVYASLSMQLSVAALEQVKASQEKNADEVKAVFEELTRTEDFVSEWRQIQASPAATGERLTEQARCADLVLMSQPDPEQDHPGRLAIMRWVMEHSGRPVMVLPRYGSFETIGNRTLIGWSGTGEAARAVHDAIPFMQQGTQTHVFWVTGGDEAHNQTLEHGGHELARCLNRHGAKAVVSHRVKNDIAIGDELLNEASDTGADLIVTGAFGHSRLYDFVIGATTSHLLTHMTVPVLFSK